MSEKTPNDAPKTLEEKLKGIDRQIEQLQAQLNAAMGYRQCLVDLIDEENVQPEEQGDGEGSD